MARKVQSEEDHTCEVFYCFGFFSFFFFFFYFFFQQVQEEKEIVCWLFFYTC